MISQLSSISLPFGSWLDFRVCSLKFNLQAHRGCFRWGWNKFWGEEAPQDCVLSSACGETKPGWFQLQYLPWLEFGQLRSSVEVSSLALLSSMGTKLCRVSFCVSVGLGVCTNPRKLKKQDGKPRCVSGSSGRHPCGFCEVTSGKTDPAWPVLERRWNYHPSSLESRLQITPGWGKPSGNPVETKGRAGSRWLSQGMARRLRAAWFQTGACAAAPQHLDLPQWMGNQPLLSKGSESLDEFPREFVLLLLSVVGELACTAHSWE